MNLYDRDFSKLTSEEEREWSVVKKQEHVGGSGRYPIKKNLFREYPKAARHFDSLFPNNYLDIVELEEECDFLNKVEAFINLIESEGVNERAILNHIKCTCSYFIVGSVLKSYYTRFGHHDAYLFPEFQLGNSFQVDYLLVGKGSGGWEFVFIEFEAPSGQITMANGDLGSSFRKGLAQIADWEEWLEAKYVSLKETFDKQLKPDATLPTEFTCLDKSRLHFVVVAGRRTDFHKKTYRIRRTKLAEKQWLLLHYDNLIDAAKNVIGKASY
jgi:hypothetical protein